MITQLDLFRPEYEIIEEMVINMQKQMDSLRKKLFAEIDELKKENEFLSLQIQLMHEKELQNC